MRLLVCARRQGSTVIEPDGFQEYVKERRVTLVRTGFLLSRQLGATLAS